MLERNLKPIIITGTTVTAPENQFFRAITVFVPAGTTIYGRFTEITVGASDTVIAYM